MDSVEKVEVELQNIEEEKAFIEVFVKKLKVRSLDEIEIRGVALTSTSIYNGIEKVLRFLLDSKDVQVTKDDAWHLQLLRASFDNHLLSKEMFEELKSFLSFRHFVRHAYTFELKKESIESIILRIPKVTGQFVEEIRHVLGK